MFEFGVAELCFLCDTLKGVVYTDDMTAREFLYLQVAIALANQKGIVHSQLSKISLVDRMSRLMRFRHSNS